MPSSIEKRVCEMGLWSYIKSQFGWTLKQRFDHFKSGFIYDSWSGRYDAEFQGLYNYKAPEFVFSKVAEYADLICNPSPRIIDVGIGTGLLSEQFKAACNNAEITGLDASKEMMKKCVEKGVADALIQMDFQNHDIPFPKAEFDLAVSSGVFELLPQPEIVIAEMARVVKPGGFVAFTTLDHCGVQEQKETGCAGIIHPDALLKQAVDDGGLELVSCDSFDAYRREGVTLGYKLYLAQKL